MGIGVDCFVLAFRQTASTGDIVMDSRAVRVYTPMSDSILPWNNGQNLPLRLFRPRALMAPRISDHTLELLWPAFSATDSMGEPRESADWRDDMASGAISGVGSSTGQLRLFRRLERIVSMSLGSESRLARHGCCDEKVLDEMLLFEIKE